VSTQAVHRAAELASAGTGKNQKAASAAAFRSYIPVFGHEVNENVRQMAGGNDLRRPFFLQPRGKLGKTEKTDSGCRADSCHGVSQ
jgi:hypothetical protein